MARWLHREGNMSDIVEAGNGWHKQSIFDSMLSANEMRNENRSQSSSSLFVSRDIAWLRPFCREGALSCSRLI